MTYSRQLISHAIYLSTYGVTLGSGLEGPPELRMISDRRAVSAAYYALFHHLSETATALIAPNVPPDIRYRIQRWVEHSEMKKVCGRFLAVEPVKPLKDLIGDTAPSDLKNVAQSFIELQDARHRADYDIGYELGSEEAGRLVILALVAMNSWDKIATTAEGNIFILSLLMWKNWEKER